MPTAVQFRRGTTAQHSSFTGAVGEITVDTDKNTVVVHDGSTAGGSPLLVGGENTSFGNLTVVSALALLINKTKTKISKNFFIIIDQKRPGLNNAHNNHFHVYQYIFS